MLQPSWRNMVAMALTPWTRSGWSAASLSASMAPIDRPATKKCSTRWRSRSAAAHTLAYQSCQRVAIRSSSLPQWPASCMPYTV